MDRGGMDMIVGGRAGGSEEKGDSGVFDARNEVIASADNGSALIRSSRCAKTSSCTVKPALTTAVNASGASFLYAAARSGRVDQTMVETVGLRGRKASGPVGRNLWKAV